MSRALDIPVIETERLRLRAPAIADHPVYAAFYAEATGAGNYGGPKSAKEAFAVLAAEIGHWVLKGHGMWVIERRDTREVVGGCGIIHPEGWPRHELTWWLLPAERGAGYATEASRAVIAWGYNVAGFDPVETHMRDENAAARALAERLGGRKIAREIFPDGVTRNVYVLPHPAREAAA